MTVLNRIFYKDIEDMKATRLTFEFTSDITDTKQLLADMQKVVDEHPDYQVQNWSMYMERDWFYENETEVEKNVMFGSLNLRLKGDKKDGA